MTLNDVCPISYMFTTFVCFLLNQFRVCCYTRIYMSCKDSVRILEMDMANYCHSNKLYFPLVCHTSPDKNRYISINKWEKVRIGSKMMMYIWAL